MALLGAHHILHVSRIRIKAVLVNYNFFIYIQSVAELTPWPACKLLQLLRFLYGAVGYLSAIFSLRHCTKYVTLPLTVTWQTG